MKVAETSRAMAWSFPILSGQLAVGGLLASYRLGLIRIGLSEKLALAGFHFLLALIILTIPVSKA